MVTLYNGASVIGTGMADASSGAYSILPTVLNEGIDVLSATATNADGTSNTASMTVIAAAQNGIQLTANLGLRAGGGGPDGSNEPDAPQRRTIDDDGRWHLQLRHRHPPRR